MNGLKLVSKIFDTAEELPFSDDSRIVLISDCHRGNGGWSDNFSKNRNIYSVALSYYYNKNYTYIEIGDGDELWEDGRFSNIVNSHGDIFSKLCKFFNDGRLHFIFGNHDMVKKNKKFVKNNLYKYFDERKKEYRPLFENVKLHEGIVLKHEVTGYKILLIHGHQVDFMNYKLWKLCRVLVRYLWRPLDSIGINDPTSASKNYKKKDLIEKKLTKWIKKVHCMLVAGHTHRPVFSEVGELPYFNDGSCIFPGAITAIEILEGNILLVKWCIKSKIDGTLYISREVIEGPSKVKDYFSIWHKES